MVDDWKEIDDELKKLEEEFSTDDSTIRYLAEPSAADYWKKRLEEETNLQAKVLETKEEEKKALQTKLSQQKEKISALEQQVKHLDRSISEEAESWQERLRAKESELMLEKQRVGWDEEIKKLQYEKKILEEEIEKNKRNYQQEQENIDIKHKKEIQELLSAQNSIVDNLESIEHEINEYKTVSEQQVAVLNQEKGKVTNELETVRQDFDRLNQQLGNIEKERILLQKKLDYSTSKLDKDKKTYYGYMNSVMNYFVTNVKNHLGTIVGIVDYCLKRIRIPKIARRQMVFITDSVNKILQEIEKNMTFTQVKKIDLQEIYAERLLNRITDNIDTGELPVGLVLKIDFQQFKKAILPYVDVSENIKVDYKSTDIEKILTINLIVPYQIIANHEYIQLKNIVFLHNWDITTVFENGKTIMSISIPVFLR